MARGPAVSVQPGANSSGRHVNDRCHCRPGKLRRHEGHVMANPGIYAIYWDAFFAGAGNPFVAKMNDFFTDGTFKQIFAKALPQYGVNPWQFVGSTVIDPPPPPPPHPHLLYPAYVEQRLTHWLQSGAVPKEPGEDETNLLYVLFTPNHTSIGTGISGYHDNGYYNKTDGNTNLFWAVIHEWHAKGLPADPQAFADSCIWCVGHEMVEAFTDRDDHGYRNDRGCEIGDICEALPQRGDTITINTRIVNGWTVQPYWDDLNAACYPP